MYCLVVHFSDLHIAEQDTLSNDKYEDIVKTINYQIETFNIAHVLIVVSGDLAYSGKKDEYLLFDRLLNALKKEIKVTSQIKVILSPGNHDIDFNDVPISRRDIVKMKNDKIESIKEDYHLKTKEFFDYSNNYCCFTKDKDIDIQVLKYDTFSIKIFNFNTATYSPYKDEISDDDRGLHSFIGCDLNSLTRSDCEMVIVLMHHSPDWFDAKTTNKLKTFIRNDVDIVLCGHEHINDELDYDYGNGLFTKKICGGPLSPGEDSLFNCIIINTDTKKYRTLKFQWNKEEEGGYDMINNEEKVLTKYTCINSGFYNELLKDHMITTISDFRDFYVFPELVVESEFNDEEKIISSFEELKDESNNKNLFIINGADYSGKTTLCKYLFLSYTGKYYPVLFDLKSLDKKKISQIIPNTYDEQYNQKLMTYSSFLKEDKEKRIAIVDDADKIDKNQFELLVDELRKTFGTVIIINGLKSEYDLLELTKKHLGESDKCLFLRIGKFYNEERFNLIKKSCSLLIANASESDINEKAALINKAILNKINIFNLYPPFIILFVKSMVNSGFEFGNKNVFNEVFSSNIVKMMTDNNVDVPPMTVLLQRIAYYIHTHKEYPLSQESLYMIISNYNKEGQGYRPEINANEAVNDLLRCRLIKTVKGNNHYCFANNSFLAYFIAKEWLRVQDKEVLVKMINNICFGINSDILLYICFMYENAQKSFFDDIVLASQQYFEKIEEIDFVKNNIKFLLQDKKEYKFLIPTNEDKKKAQKNIKKQEKEVTRDSKINYIDVYDYDDNELLDDAKAFNKGLKFIEILSKILPDFIFKMEPVQIKSVVESLYILPNKLLYSLLKPFDDEISKILSSDILSDQINRFEINDSIKELQDVSKLIVLNIYDMVSRYSVSKSTIKALDKFSCKGSINYSLQKAMFYSEIGDTQKFDKLVMTIYDCTDNIAIKNIVKRIYFKHILFNQIEYRGEIQKHISKLFPGVNKSRLTNAGKPRFLTVIRTNKKK